MSHKIVFFGNERLATGVTTTAPTLRALIDAGYNVVAVVIAQDPTSRSRKARPLEIAEIAGAAGIPVLTPPKLAEIKDELASLQADAGVLAAFGKYVPSSIINLFPYGIVNIHPSLLPKHRGPTPLESVILAGDLETGVSLMQLVAHMDSGPIFAQETVRLEGNETKQALADQLLATGAAMLISYLPSILSGTLTPQPQDETRAQYDEKIAKDAGTLTGETWHKPVAELDRAVRAYAGWPRSRTNVAGTDIIITRAHIGSGYGAVGTLWIAEKSFGVQAIDGVLVIDALIPAGKKEMPASAFLAGYQLPRQP
ncbi:MAG: methionyl-tRNA formyltransferase [Candidatus Saccharibacteria bacterium]